MANSMEFFEDEAYKMDSKHRGIALIFNHETYKIRLQNQPVLPRAGTKYDAAALKTLLKDEFGFHVKVYNNKTCNQIRTTLRNASKANHSKSDCLIVVILTHGDGDNGLFANDGRYLVNEVWEPFFADKCPDLVGKPKLFFIQACRGQEVDHGVHYPDTSLNIKTNKKFVNFSKEHVDMPNDPTITSDILIMFSTCPGFVSWRSELKGSPFIQTLCEELHENEDTTDLLSILNGVNRRVAFEYESKTLNLDTAYKKQMPSIISTLRKDIFLTRKEVTTQDFCCNIM